MKVKSNFMGNDTKIKANTIVVVDNNKAKTLDNVLGNLSDLDTTNKDSLVSAVNEVSNFYQKTTNGFVLKFANGFMIERKTMTFNKQFTADGSVFSTTNNLGNWDVPFKKLLDFNYSIGNINGSRSVWVSSNSWISGEGATDPTTTSAGTVITLLTWAGNAQYDVSCTAFGLWK